MTKWTPIQKKIPRRGQLIVATNGWLTDMYIYYPEDLYTGNKRFKWNDVTHWHPIVLPKKIKKTRPGAHCEDA